MRTAGIYDDSQWQRGGKLWLLYCGLSIVVGVMDWVGWMKLPRRLIESTKLSVRQPVTVVMQAIESPFHWMSQGINASNRIASLESRLSAAAVDQAKLDELEVKVAQLESLVQAQPSGYKASKVAELYRVNDHVWIAAGQQDQIKLGEFVVDHHGVFIGKIGTIGQYTSRLVLPGDDDFRLPVQTSNGSAKGVIEKSGSQVIISSVLQTETLQVGDILVTSGTDSTIPPRIVVAQVTRLTGKSSDPTKGGEVALLADIQGWGAIW